MRFPLLICSVVLLGLLGACGGSRKTFLDGLEAAQGTGASGESPHSLESAGGTFPLPSELLRKGSDLQASDGTQVDGSKFADWLPSRNVEATDEGEGSFDWNTNQNLRFIPQSDTPAGLEHAAYAFYSLTGMPLDSQQARLCIDWVQAPSGSCFVGLANFEQNRWDWRVLNQDETVIIPDILPCLKANGGGTGFTYVAVLVESGEPALLDCLALGEKAWARIQLVKDLNPNKAMNLAPRTVNWQVFAQLAGADFVSMDIDCDGQPGYELVGRTEGQVSQLYELPGAYQFNVRLHDDRGDTHDLAYDFTIVDPANQAPVAELLALQASGDAPLSSSLVGSGSSDPDGEITRYRFDIDSDGSFEFDSEDISTVDWTFGAWGENSVTLEVTDNNFATDTASATVEVLKGWRRAPVVSSVSVKDMSMAVTGITTGVRPALAYSLAGSPTKYGNAMYVVVASQQNGSAWGSPMLLRDAPDKVETGHSLKLRQLSTYTLGLAYSEEQQDTLTNTLYYLHSTNLEATDWSSPQALHTAQYSNDSLSLAVIDGNPAIVSCDPYHESSQSHLYYHSAQDASGNDWSAPQTILAGADEYSRPALVQGPQGPVCAFSQAISGNIQGSGVDVLQQTGSGAVEWLSAGIWPLWREYINPLRMSDGSLMFLVGDPFRDGKLQQISSSMQGGQLAWSPQLIDHTPHGYPGGGDCDAVLESLKPAIFFASNVGADLMYRKAGDPFGQEWQPPYPIWSSDLSRVSLCEAEMAGSKPVVCYYDAATKTIYASWYE
ncbi:PKD domain-containing protein [bacterium]|nr:PKD domain-containing protein [bacterium]